MIAGQGGDHAADGEPDLASAPRDDLGLPEREESAREDVGEGFVGPLPAHPQFRQGGPHGGFDLAMAWSDHRSGIPNTPQRPGVSRPSRFCTYWPSLVKMT